MLIEFSNELLTEVEEMDNQHEKLVEMLNHVYLLLKEGKKLEAEEFFYNEIVSYVETHLKDEENFMEEIGYPDLENHKKVHEIFREEIYKLAPYIKSGDDKAFKSAVALSWGWLYNHILKTDKKYALYAKEKGCI